MEGKRRVLFLCTGNSCRSQMAEAILRHVGGDRFESLSAGSHPAGFIHPLAEAAMTELGVSMAAQLSKSWDEFTDYPVDVVISVCDAAASLPCPAFPGNAIRAHWSLPDPTYHPGTIPERIEFAIRIARRLLAKIEGLTRIDWSQPRTAIEQQLAFLGEI